MNRILVLSRREIEKNLDGYFRDHRILGDWALISIYRGLPLLNTFKRTEALKLLGCKDFLSLQFSDIEKPIDHVPFDEYEPILFNEKQARRIIAFIDKARQFAQTLVVHCAAGISRSGAVGLFACRYLGLDENEFRETNIISPNMHVLSVLNEVSGVNKDYVEFWENIKTAEPNPKIKFT